MCQRVAVNSVFLPLEEKVEKYKHILPSGPPHYSPKVKIHDWQLRSPVEARANEIRNFRESTYKRLGEDDDPTGISVTRAMTEQIRTKDNYDSTHRNYSMLNFYSLPYTETNEYKRAFALTDLHRPKATEIADYRTTLRDDYPPHYKTTPRSLRDSLVPEVPWLLYRRILGYNSDDLARRSGVSKFLDDNMEIQNRAAALKMSRFVSYDPAARKYTDTKKFSEAILKNSSVTGSASLDI